MTRNTTWPFITLLVALLFGAPCARADDAAHAKAASLVDAAIQLTDSDQAVKMLWEATNIDPTFTQAYVYLGLYYNSREDFANVVKVYKKLVQYHPNEVSAYLNIGEAYMSFNPPHYEDALPFYQKAYALDSHSSFAALRIGELLAHSGDRENAVRYLKQASDDTANNPGVAAEAARQLKQLAGF